MSGAVVAALTVAPTGMAQASGVVRHVDAGNKSCTNSGTGSTTAPYCTIQAAASAVQPGDTVLVASGTYTESVTIKNSGTSTAPITFKPEAGATVTVTGQIHAFTVSGTATTPTSWITISGFQVTHTTQYGIYLKYADHITLSGNHVTYSGSPGSSGTVAQGIYILNTTNSLIVGNTTDHNSDTGIYITTGTSNVEIRGNTSFANARQYTRAATGIDVRSAGNVIDGNRCYNNEDSGIQLYNGANQSVVFNNLSYGNGDHGIDVLNSMNVVVVSNSVYNNVTAGINLEGNSTAPSSGGTVRDNVSVDNGLTSTSTKGDIRVDTNSIPGTTLDYDLVYLHSSGVMMTWGTKTYSTLSSFTNATGQENHGLGTSDPGWKSPASGDFHLTAGSKAIDSADSSAPNEPSTDFDGASRVDDPATPNIGVGPRTYDDRGALEYQPDNPPVAALSVTPTSGTAPVSVTADASASTDGDATPIATYAFDFGDGSAVVGPQGDATASYTYANAGTYAVTVTVTDTAGNSRTATATVKVTASDLPPQAALSVTPNAGTAPLDVVADASGSTDTDLSPIATYSFDFGDGSAVVGPQQAATASHTFQAAGTYTVTVTENDTAGLTSSAKATVVVGLAAVDEVHYSFLTPTSVAFDWRGGPSTLRYGADKKYGNSVTGHAPDPMPFSSAGPFWEAVVTGLTPGTTYHYSIGGSPDSTFETEPTGSFRFDAEGDIGDSVTYPNVGTTQGQIASDNPDMVLGIGDLTYGEAHGQQAVDQHFNDVMGWSQTAAYMAVWGNHEWESVNDDLRNYKGRFDIPNGAAATGAPSLGCCGEDWGWLDAGGVRFISYPEPYTSTTWSDWQPQADALMSAAQSDPSIGYIVTFGHRPAYSTGNHTGEVKLTTVLNALGDKYSKYVLNINGHSHDYERFVPIHGVTHITAGGGGATLEPPWSTTDPRTAYRAMHLAHLRVDVTPTAMTISAICGPATAQDDTSCTLGSVIDSTTIPTPPTHDDPPAAAVTLTPSTGSAPLVVSADASGSTDTDTTPIASYAFDFGDGTVVPAQSSPTVSHTYSAAGTYTVTVTVTDTVGRPSTATAKVTVSASVTDNPPTVGLSVTPTAGTAPLAVSADASASTDGDATPISTYTFDFGDGTVVGPQPGSATTHTYAAAGTYTVTTTVTDTGGLSAKATATVKVTTADLPPKASLKVSPTSGSVPVTVTADASGSSDTDGTPIATYTFDFGDGTVVGPQAGASATHQYTAAGSYPVTMTVVDTAGLTSTATKTVTASNDQAPVAALAVSPASGQAPLNVTADASGSTDTDATPIASYRFDFGDGTVVGPQASATATHTYTTGGTYTLSVLVTDTAGLSSTKATVQVPVGAAAGTNFVGNSGFETNTSGWNVSGRAGITLTQVAGGHSGSFAAQLTNTNSTTAADCTLNDSPNWVSTTQASKYTATIWVQGATAGAKLTLRLREYNGSTFVGSNSATIILSTAWQQLSVSYTPANPGTSNIDLNAYLTNAAPGVCFAADDITETVS